MAKSNRENEIKLAFASAETAVRRLVDAGACAVRARALEDNVLFDLEGLPLRDSGRVLRLREFAGKAVLTFKSSVPGAHAHKVAVEHETTVEDPEALRSILQGLGFSPVFRYQKYRSIFRLGAVEACVDETPIGTFVELEGQPDDVDRAAQALGAGSGDFIRETYRELQEKDAAARGVAAGDMLVTPSGGANPAR